MKRVLLVIFIVAICGALYATYEADILNCSQWTRIWGTNGFSTTLTIFDYPSYIIKNDLTPPEPPGLELVGYVIVRFKTGTASFKYPNGARSAISVPDSVGDWTVVACDWDTNYISTINSNLVVKSGDAPYGIRVTTSNSKSAYKVIIAQQSYTRLIFNSIQTMGEIEDPLDETSCAQYYVGAEASSNAYFFLTTETTSNSDNGLTTLFIFYEL